MPIVAKDRAEYELKRQRLLDDYAALAKQREIYKKSVQHYKDVGTPLFQPDDEPKTSTEQLLDKSRVDVNLERLLVKDLDSNSGQAKIFIQSMDEDIKSNILDKFPAFQKAFNSNFTVASATNLKATLDLFLKGEIEKAKDVDVPTIQIIQDYIATLSPTKRGAFAVSLTAANSPFLTRAEATRRFNEGDGNLVREIRKFVKQYPSELVGYTALYRLGERVYAH